MSAAGSSGTGDAADVRRSAGAKAATWLAFAASPTFAVMASLSAGGTGEAAAMLCGAAHGAPLGGMPLMYLLMSAFHAGPWLKRIGMERQAQTSDGRRGKQERSRALTVLLGDENCR